MQLCPWTQDPESVLGPPEHSRGWHCLLTSNAKVPLCPDLEEQSGCLVGLHSAEVGKSPGHGQKGGGTYLGTLLPGSPWGAGGPRFASASIPLGSHGPRVGESLWGAPQIVEGPESSSHLSSIPPTLRHMADRDPTANGGWQFKHEVPSPSQCFNSSNKHLLSPSFLTTRHVNNSGYALKLDGRERSKCNF